MTTSEEQTAVLRKNLLKSFVVCPESYEWIDGEAWYQGEPIQGRTTANEQAAINLTLAELSQSHIPALSRAVVGNQAETQQ